MHVLMFFPLRATFCKNQAVLKGMVSKNFQFFICGRKYKIAEDIYANFVTYVEKLVVLLKDLHMKFISDVKLYFIKAL